ncbi:hypothetical protein [Thomasclavelia cocleata]|uniref:hypothetical protein n=1 Tax=Thomasclavelia cocleata TaxID=69824 RepID=UPI00256FD89D|nr:hypothetical protein [Thomasclavelia cocleata]
MGKNVTQPIKKSFVKSVSYDCPEPVSLSVPSSLKSAKRSNRKESLQRFNNVFVPRFLESDRKFYSRSSAGFFSSFMSILFIGLFAMLVISLISPNSNLTFKGFMMSLSELRFRNSWLTSLTSVSDAFEKIKDFNYELPGGFQNIVVIFTSFFEWIVYFADLIVSIVLGLFNLFMDFIVNIGVVLKFLVTFGAIIT